MGLFSSLRGPRGIGSGRADLERLQAWVGQRRGVEVYVEPATSVSGMSVLLVAHDGEWTREDVASAKAAADFARSIGVPVYDTNRVGIPQRKRDYDVRTAKGRSTHHVGPGRPGASAGRPAPSGPTPQQRDAMATLAREAGASAPTDPDHEELARLVRQARGHAHPDRNGGDRTRWDAVESAARVLGL